MGNHSHYQNISFYALLPSVTISPLANNHHTIRLLPTPPQSLIIRMHQPLNLPHQPPLLPPLLPLLLMHIPLPPSPNMKLFIPHPPLLPHRRLGHHIHIPNHPLPIPRFQARTLDIACTATLRGGGAALANP